MPYSIPNYPSSINPATDGCRNLTGRGNGTVMLYAVTSTVSASGDQGADPNTLVKVKDLLNASAPPNGRDFGQFATIRAARSGEVLRGIDFAPTAYGSDE